MEVIYESSFLTSLKRIDNKVMINSCKIGIRSYGPEVVYHKDSEVMHVCITGVDGECDKLEFYYGDDQKAFTIKDTSPIRLNPERTIFEFKLPEKPEAEIGCPWLTQDTEFIESPGLELGYSLYKNIEVPDNTLIWKESIPKYVTDRGNQGDHVYNVERLDTKSGKLEERPIRFKSYQNIIIDQGNWRIDTITTERTVKKDIYSEVSSSNFLVWDSPMVDSSIDYTKTAECIENFGEYVDPGNTIFGNTDCFQYIKYSKVGQEFKGFRIKGTMGSKVRVLFNRESTTGSYTEFECVVGENGEGEVMIPELQYYHFNGIVSSGPSKIDSIETIIYRDDLIDDVVPNPDKTYLAEIDSNKGSVKIYGNCDYIEYEKYLDDINEIGRGTESINSIPGIEIIELERDGFNGTIDSLAKKIDFEDTGFTSQNYITATYQVIIRNNIKVEGGKMITGRLESDYKIKIVQEGIIWKFGTSPDYVYEADDSGIYIFKSPASSSRSITILTNLENPNVGSLRFVENENYTIMLQYFNASFSYEGQTLIDGEYWEMVNLNITTKTKNDTGEWRPRTGANNDPIRVDISYNGVVLRSISFCAIQLKEIIPELEIWEETLPGKFTQVTSGQLTIYNDLTKNFLVAKKVSGIVVGESWYYYDLDNNNKFYLTDTNSNMTNQGFIFERTQDTDIIELDEWGQDERTQKTRVINVNRSDLINSLGVLTATESAGYPSSWRDLLNQNTMNIEVLRELTNVYIQVGEDEESLKNEDYVLEVSKIGVYSITIRTNFKYVAEVSENGYLRFINDSTLSTKKTVLTGYAGVHTYKLALTRLDDKDGLGKTVLEIRSGGVVRKVTIKVSEDLETTHSIDLHDYDTSGYPEKKPGILRIFNNGSLSPTNKNVFFYKSTTTPQIGYNNFTGTSIDTVKFKSNAYQIHRSEVIITVPNSRKLSYSKYPISSFGNITESSLSYSDLEGNPLEYYFYMKGKEHRIWYSDTIYDFTGISDSNVPTESNIYIDAAGESGKTIYLVSRYSFDNRTFSTEIPAKTDIKIKRNELEVQMKLEDLQRLAKVDEVSQIEYYLPIQVSCNVENNGGNVYLGSLDFKAITKIADSSISDVIVAEDSVIEAEGIDANYIKNYIVADSTQNLSFRVFQAGTSTDILEIYSDVTDFGIDADTKYIVPEIGTSLSITSFSTSINPNDDQCVITPENSNKFFLIRVDSKDRVSEDEDHWFNASDSRITTLAADINYTVTTTIGYDKAVGDTVTSGSKTFTSTFKRYGCNYGMFVSYGSSSECGLGNAKSYNSKSRVEIPIPKEGGRLLIKAGLAYVVNGISSTEALIVPREYKFIGDNKPLTFEWEDGNRDDDGNLVATFLPRVRDDHGEKRYTLQVTQDHEYYPLNVYIDFVQSAYSEGDSGKRNYQLNFDSEKIYLNSDGTFPENGDGKIYFTHNLNQETFNDLTFGWEMRHPDTDSFPLKPDKSIADLEEEERSFEEGYVKFKFKPNGSRTFIKAYIVAKLYGNDIGLLPIDQGYLSLEAYFRQGRKYPDDSYDPDVVPTTILSRLDYILLTSDIDDRGLKSYVYNAPCKANDDNSRSDSPVSRGVYELRLFQKEYYQDEEVTYIKSNLSPLVDKVELIMPLTPVNAYELSDIVCTPQSTSDSDAKTDPQVNDGKQYATTKDYGTFTPYFEVVYKKKEDYIRRGNSTCARGKVFLKLDKLNNTQEFLFTSWLSINSTNEPPNVENFKLGTDKIKFDLEGGNRLVSFTPSYKYMIGVEVDTGGEGNWLDYEIGDDAIKITASDNKSTTLVKAHYRVGSVVVTLWDIRYPNNDPSGEPIDLGIALAKYVIEVEQDFIEDQ